MCGISGVIDFDNYAVEPSILLAMNQAIAHRGPDDEGYVLINQQDFKHATYAGADSASGLKSKLPVLTSDLNTGRFNIGLGHRRFSIIDLTEGGHQPFVDREGRCCLVFNGEIYNYLEIREQLKNKGINFATQSDTEVLAEAYKVWGTDCFSRLNGFWAIAIYDFENRQLLVSRDRIGKKPLYWTRVASRLYFASEIKALLRIPEVYRDRKVNEDAISTWLTHGKKDLNFTTCFKGIFSLPAASWAVVDKNFPHTVRTYWSLPKERLEEAEISPESAAQTLRDLLEDAVSIRLRADVPLSVELSGGMDSSTLVALASQLRPHAITTYTVRFAEKEWNEEPFANSVARRWKTDYRVLESPISNFWSQILQFTYLEEEPYHSPNLQTNQAIWSQMRAMGARVSINGAGGDEDFAGYGGYFSLFQIENLLRGRLPVYLRNALHYSSGRTHLRSLLLPALRLPGRLLSRAGKKAGNGNGKSALLKPLTLSEALYSDMTNTLMPYWLRSGDRGYMGIPLEVRAPFLDYRVVEFAFRLPTTYLFREGWHKWILRKAVEDLLPPDVVWRRQKLGFPFPYERFYSEYKSIIDLIVKDSHNPYLSGSQKVALRNDWNTLSFLLWYELFFNENLMLFDEIQKMATCIRSAESYDFTPEFLHSWSYLR